MVAQRVLLNTDMTFMTTYYIFLSNTTSCEENIFRVLGMWKRHPFWCCGIPTKMQQFFFVTDDTDLTPLCKHVLLPFIQHMYKINHVGLIMKGFFKLPVCVA